MYICKFCKKECKNKNSLTQHEIRCKENPNRISIDKIGARKGKIPWNKGLTKETDERVKLSEETKKKIGNKSKGRKHSKETKKYMSELTKERYANGWEVKCGRAPKIDYESPIAGKVKLDGSWELKTAIYLDKLKVKWKRNKNRFHYINLKGKNATYCPDFWVEDWNTYIEVKGYKTDLDKCKWKQFEHELLIWEKEDLKKRGIL